MQDNFSSCNNTANKHWKYRQYSIRSIGSPVSLRPPKTHAKIYAFSQDGVEGEEGEGGEGGETGEEGENYLNCTERDTSEVKITGGFHVTQLSRKFHVSEK